MSLTRLRLLVAVSFIIGCLPLNVAAEEEASPTPNSGWAINFELEEHFRGAETLPRIIHFEVNDTGRYLAKYHLISDNIEISTLHTDEGNLEKSQMDHLKTWLDIIKDSDIKTSDETLKLGYGLSLQPGWLGRLTLQRGEQVTKIAFNSLKSEADQRPQVANQLVTLILDLKRLTLGKFGLNRKLAKASEDPN